MNNNHNIPSHVLESLDQEWDDTVPQHAFDVTFDATYTEPIDQTHAPNYIEHPLHVQAEQKNQQIKQLLHSVARTDTDLARDIAYVGTTDPNYIVTMYGITHEELSKKLDDPVFVKIVERFRTEIGDDARGLLRVRSNAYLDSSISRLHDIIKSPATKDENVIRGITLLSQLSGAIQRDGGGSHATQVVFNFGTGTPNNQAPPIPVNESDEVEVVYDGD